MRLLNVHTLCLGEEIVENPPSYAIASHRWSSDEISFQEMEKAPEKRSDINTSGYAKVAGFAKFVKLHLPHLDWMWIDTCCINKSNLTELQEAIISMCRWYREADVCLAYLADVEAENDLTEFKKSEWFCRGWTLQELIAPQTVIFLTKTWQVIGHKGRTGRSISGIEVNPGLPLTDAVIAASRVPKAVLDDFDQKNTYEVQERLAWMTGRTTKLKEDLIYSLLGIFDISLPILYGEGYDTAKKRLLLAIHQENEDFRQQVILKQQLRNESQDAIDRLAAPDPWSNHAAARKLHDPNTGSWLLRSEEYRLWKCCSLRHIWLLGKAGCGKTILCSSVVEDIRVYCNSVRNSVIGAFYFSFSDNRKQSYEYLLRSLVAQLASGTGLSTLCRALRTKDAAVPQLYKLEEILYESVRSYGKVFILLDALDECSETDGGQHDVLDFLENLSKVTTNVKIFATSRDILAVANSMDNISASPIVAAGQKVNDDICNYVNAQISRESRLKRLSDETKSSIADTLSQNADGMFRWAYCQLRELRQMKSTKPDKIAAALADLPGSLDETYERMLLGIDQSRDEALVLLKWLAYRTYPPTLDELTEASVINLDDDIVATKNRGSLEDTLDILAGLVVTYEDDPPRKRPPAVTSRITDMNEGTDASDEHGLISRTRNNAQTKVRLAHYSVKEYLESKRIRQSRVQQFQLTEAEGHEYLAQSCIIYLRHCSSKLGRTSPNDLKIFPLLKYAAWTWDYHSSRQSSCRPHREVALLTSDKAVGDWLLWCQPRRQLSNFGPREQIRSALYFASCLGLLLPVQELLRCGVDVNATGGRYGTALQAASQGGFTMVVEALLGAGADVNATGGRHSTALQAASQGGFRIVVEALLGAGADINATGGRYGTALQAASEGGFSMVVEALLGAGADVNATGGRYGTALQAASQGGFRIVVEALLGAGADANATGGRYGTALQAASQGGFSMIVEALLGAGAEVNTTGGGYGTALQAASQGGFSMVVEALLEAGADVNACGDGHGGALLASSLQGYETIVRMLIKAGADVNAKCPPYDSVLLALTKNEGTESNSMIAKLLIDGGADVNAPGRDGDPLQLAIQNGDESMVRLLLESGANVNAEVGIHRCAMWAALIWGSDRIVQLLNEYKADSKLQGRDKLGRSLIHLSASVGSRNGIERALEAGQSLNAEDNQLWTPLHWAAYFGKMYTIRRLIRWGANQYLRDRSGRTPWDVAVMCGHDDMWQFLEAQESCVLEDISWPADETMVRGRCDSCTHVSVSTNFHLALLRLRKKQ